MSKIDDKFMAQALKLAVLGGRSVAPNPMVGALIVKNLPGRPAGDRIIGKGWHQKFGGPHAEVNAIKSVRCKADLRGATLYVTLEPCRHFGKTPPCMNLIESVGITRVVCGSRDPFQKGRRPSEITFISGPIAKKCRELNKFFFTWVTRKRPYITVKIATSADGFVAGHNGEHIHFTSRAQDKYVHQLRAQHQAIMVGSGTVISDNPSLTVRYIIGKDPLRIILDSRKRVSKNAKVFKNKNYLHITKRTPLKTLFRQLAARGIASVLVEPGPTLYASLKKVGLIDALIVLKGSKKIGLV
ncbi:bifunctional diaminohydroxyphosphoribosylaminopyrimidine deaminase/5-amino-6-(5-phosphoribosylamino)uracil reductase RibD [Patescibacteria group bacterium]|nr:bifunctional diaminohydroxyphosphoribosylaminopyrimidine deaminase/5-amino-6-(5-phosphoribosylamino)uracil reductase RibD [Patescibacteria group bacterium]MBU1015756.1 bifunctional diaminohydroxyphosphoribosylaminopyrimidine deaminase/5-amino-6-(5-phosphoribosylamino)uracil reductase RibD [Patescibacteria group bacterium]MBU1685518.1 bifunctional diaminohydroxyphosphoribosylaminopyrimidine deaminase/5-amino-6-(5-phosphoribosylamino)uracil reductase RibD [Patescibacteria group bacterium]MBU193